MAILNIAASQPTAISALLTILFNFATSDAYNMRQPFHCLQWYVGGERVKPKRIGHVCKFTKPNFFKKSSNNQMFNEFRPFQRFFQLIKLYKQNNNSSDFSPLHASVVCTNDCRLRSRRQVPIREMYERVYRPRRIYRLPCTFARIIATEKYLPRVWPRALQI